MSRNRGRKKRNKVYSGSDAKEVSQSSEPVIHRYQAVVRNPASQWWYDHKKTVKISAIVIGVVGFLTWIIISGISLIF